jgi:hypothetical protein
MLEERSALAPQKFLAVRKSGGTLPKRARGCGGDDDDDDDDDDDGDD